MEVKSEVPCCLGNIDDGVDMNAFPPPTTNNSPQATQDGDTSEPKSKRFKSVVWNYFVKCGLVDGKDKCKCIGCGKLLTCGGTSHGTSHLKRHIESCKLLPKYHDVSNMLINYEEKVSPGKIDQKVQHELLVHAIIMHDLPYEFIQYEGIRRWVKYINPDIHFVSGNTLLSDTLKVYNTEKENLKQLLARIPGRICLTYNKWTACTTQDFICLAAHFVDEDWSLNNKILNFYETAPPFAWFDLANLIIKFLKDWEIDRKIFSITLDDASNSESMVDYLRTELKLQNSLLCDGEFFHIRCCAYILNLIVQEGLKVASDVLNNIRDSIKYWKANDGRKTQLKSEIEAAVEIETEVNLYLDMSTCWNSTYVMLDAAIKYRHVFSSLELVDPNYKYCPSNEEWERAEKMCAFLEPFSNIINLFSNRSYPTSNLYFNEFATIECLLLNNMRSEDGVIKDMAKRMKEKFDKFWKEYSLVLAYGVVLDPRMKFAMLEFWYKEIDESSLEIKISVVKKKLYQLFEAYTRGKFNSSSSGAQTESSLLKSTDGGKGKNSMKAFKQYESQSMVNSKRSELDLYLDEAKLEYALYEDLDVLQYWRNHKNRFPILSIMACDVLSIPITSVASNTAFSIGSRVLNKLRSGALPENTEFAICTRNWLHGYEENVGIENDDSTTKYMADSEIFNVASNLIEEVDEN